MKLLLQLGEALLEALQGPPLSLQIGPLLEGRDTPKHTTTNNDRWTDGGTDGERERETLKIHTMQIKRSKMLLVVADASVYQSTLVVCLSEVM